MLGEKEDPRIDYYDYPILSETTTAVSTTIEKAPKGGGPSLRGRSTTEKSASATPRAESRPRTTKIGKTTTSTTTTTTTTTTAAEAQVECGELLVSWFRDGIVKTTSFARSSYKLGYVYNNWYFSFFVYNGL